MSAPLTRRDLTALRSAIGEITTGAPFRVTLRTAEDGRFEVSGNVRRDLTDTAYKVGWWDITTGKGEEPVPELQQITPLTTVEVAGLEEAPHHHDVLVDLLAQIEPGIVVTALFDFEGCGTFTISGEPRHGAGGAVWVVAGHLLGHASAPAPRLRRLTLH